MTSLRRCLRVVPVLVFFLPWVCRAASPAAPGSTYTSRAQAAGQNGAANVPVLKVRSDLVLVDVVVTKNGVPVKGLTQDKFRVLENGKQQELKVFEEHSEAEQAAATDSASSASTNGTAPSNPAGTKAPALPPNTYSDFTPNPPSSAVNVLLLDALNTPSTDQGNVRKQMLEYLKKIPPGTQIAVLTLSSQLRMVQGFTADASLLAKAIADKDAITRSMAEVKTSSNEMREEVVSNLLGIGYLTDDAIEMQQFAADLKSFDTDHQEEITLTALRQIARYLTAIPGRKNLVWFSGSFPLYIDPVAFDTTVNMKDSMTGDTVKDACNPNPSRTTRDYAAEVRETDRQLTAARIAVYPVDAKGLLRESIYDASANQAATLCLFAQANPVAKAHQLGHAESQAEDESRIGDVTLQTIAADTGGKAFINTNGFEDAIRQALADGAHYYTIGYMPEGKDDGQLRKIKVNVDGGYQLEYRDGYYADAPGHGADAGASTMKEAIQFGAPPPSEIPFKVRVIASTDPAAQGFTPAAGPAGADAKDLKPPVTRYLIDYTVDANHFTFQKTPDGVEHARLEFAVLAYDAEGKIINFTQRGFGLDLPPEPYAQFLSGGFPEHQEIDLPAGQFVLRVVVHDLGSSKAGATEVPLMVAKK